MEVIGSTEVYYAKLQSAIGAKSVYVKFVSYLIFNNDKLPCLIGSEPVLKARL